MSTTEFVQTEVLATVCGAHMWDGAIAVARITGGVSATWFDLDTETGEVNGVICSTIVHPDEDAALSFALRVMDRSINGLAPNSEAV